LVIIMVSSRDARVLIVVFDALRPEFLNSYVMPNLSAFAEAGVRYTDSHSTFPTETRVNQSAVTTGCMPRGHGIVGNKFVVDDLGRRQVLNTGDDAALEAAIPHLRSGLLGVPTLSEIVTANGLSYASLSTGTSGGGRLINPRSDASGSFRLALRRPEASTPHGAFDAVTAKIGPMPTYALPAKEWVTWGVNAYLDYVETEIAPDVMVLWLCEPDESFHKLGIGSPASIEAISHVDREFGRILEHHAGSLADGSLQIVAMSDHGQTTLAGEPLDLPSVFTDAGFAAVGASDQPVCHVVVDNAGGVWLDESQRGLRGEMIAWLREQPWCGPLFTADGIAGTLRQADICIEHPRAPDISLVLRSDQSANAWGYNGTTQHDAPYPIGGGCHGGLSRAELHNVLTLGGSAFAGGRVIDVPAGNIDVLPTVLHVLGVDIPAHIEGRILREALRGAGDEQGDLPVRRQSLQSTNTVGPITKLECVEVQGARYLHEAWVEPNPK
jgi:hypothetical protein